MFKNRGGILYLIGLLVLIIVFVVLYFKYGEGSEVDEQINDTKDISALSIEN